LQNINNRSKLRNCILSYTKAGLNINDIGPISERKQKRHKYKHKNKLRLLKQLKNAITTHINNSKVILENSIISQQNETDYLQSNNSKKHK